MLNENRLSRSDRETLDTIRGIARSLGARDDQNAVHFLAVEHTSKWHQNGFSGNLSQAYRLWFVEAGRIRLAYRSGHKVRWFRADWYGVAEDPYYTPFKRFAQSANPNAFDSRKDSQKMSIALSDLVKNRVIDYADLRLQDNTRQRKENSVKGWNGILLAIEKDAMWNNELTRFAENLGMLVVTSGKGEPSRNSNEMVYNIIRNSGLSECVLLTITDFDQYGFYIENSFAEHLETYEDMIVNHFRVGTDPSLYSSDRLTPEDALYELPPSSQRWERAIEIGDGKKYGIEMDTNSWSFYFKAIIEKLLEIGYTEEDFDEWARKYRWAKDYRAIEDAIDEILGGVDFYQKWLEMRGLIDPLIELTRRKIKDQIEPQSDPFMEEDDFDDRESQIDKLVKDLTESRAYESRYSSTELTEKLQGLLEGWFDENGELPSKEEIEQEIRKEKEE
jgi:hypothetical protein